METLESLQRTVLFESHVAAGGRMVPFAGWEMPVQYGGVIGEVRAVREGCGVFDVSHMARFSARGANVGAALNQLVCSNWAETPNNSATYSLLLNQNGGTIDDIMGYHVSGEHWDIVSNASRIEVVEAHLRAHLPASIALENRTAQTAMLAIQGPRAFELLSAHGNLPHPMVWRNYLDAELFDVAGQLARGGYTGSDGFEFIFPAKFATEVWDNLLKAGVTAVRIGRARRFALGSGFAALRPRTARDLDARRIGRGLGVQARQRPVHRARSRDAGAQTAHRRAANGRQSDSARRLSRGRKWRSCRRNYVGHAVADGRRGHRFSDLQSFAGHRRLDASVGARQTATRARGAQTVCAACARMKNDLSATYLCILMP